MQLTLKKKPTLANHLVIEDLGPKPKFPGKIRVVDAPFYSFAQHGLTSSFLNEFLACKKRAELSYLQGWTSVSFSNPIVFGSLFHECLDRVYSSFKLGIKLEAINIKNTIENVLHTYKLKENIWTPEKEENHILNEGYLKILLPAYLKKYAKRDQMYKWALIEEQFNNVYQGVRLRGKFDRVAVNKSGETWLFETKTKGRIDPEIQTRLSFDPQVMIYLLNYELQYKIKPVGFIYDIICRPALRKGKSETLKHFMDRVKGDVDDSYFFRIQQRLDEKEYTEWKREFNLMLQDFKVWIHEKKSHYRNPAACETRFGNCKFLKVCGGNDFIGLEKRKEVMPELVEK
jgi:hypothetical protein